MMTDDSAAGAWYRICLNGCDDRTTARMWLTADQATWLREVARALTAAASYGCQPTMTAEEEGADDGD